MAQPPVIRVPRPARSSYQPHRPLSKNTLLQSHVIHFRELERDLPPEHQTGIPFDEIKTEGQAAEYIRRMTKRLLQAPAKT